MIILKPILKTDIIGAWELTSLKADGLELIEDADCLNQIIFTASTVQSNEYEDNEDDKGCVLDYESDAGPYSISGNKLTGTVDDQTITFEIIELNAATLKMSGAVTEEGVTLTFIQTFKRL